MRTINWFHIYATVLGFSLFNQCNRQHSPTSHSLIGMAILAYLRIRILHEVMKVICEEGLKFFNNHNTEMLI